MMNKLRSHSDQSILPLLTPASVLWRAAFSAMFSCSALINR